MSIVKKSIPFALSALALSLAQVAHAAVPTSGAYVTDKQSTWVQDRVGDRISTVNMIMCIMSSLRSDAMVNQGAYVALVDENKCQGRGDSSRSTSNSAGASNATNYMSATVLATQDSSTSPLIVKAWMHEESENDGQPDKSTIFVYITASAGKTDAHPNGLFSMYFCGTSDADTSNPKACGFKGTLKSDDSGLTFYEAENHGNGPSETAMKLQVNSSTDTGSGRLSGEKDGSPYTFAFAYDPTTFHRNDGTVEACFSRDKDVADYSTWRYGTYHADGSRLEASNQGFPVKFTRGTGDSATTAYGYWSFWGLWLPDSALANLGSGTLSRRVGSVDQPLTVVSKGGKLWKLTRKTAALDDFKNVPMMYWAPGNVGSLQAGKNYELQWNGDALKAVSMQDCSSGQCTSEPLSPQVDLHASDFTTSHANTLPIFFPSGGGNGAVVVPSSGDFTGGNFIYYRTRDVVQPDASDAPSHLNCLSMCPKSGTTLTNSFPESSGQGQQGQGQQGQAQSVNPGPGQGQPQAQADPFLAQSWQPVAVGQQTAYDFAAGMLSNSGGNVDVSGLAKNRLGMYQWGVTSGFMVDDASLNSVKCDTNGTPNTSGSQLCPGLIDQAPVSYQWETGPNQWNQFFGAQGVVIEPPKSLSFAASGNPQNIRIRTDDDINKYAGNTVQLQFSGFGELQGIPGNCVNPDTNQPAPCNQNNRFVPAFDILDDSTVSDGNSNFYVKYLEREMRLHQNLSCVGAPTLPGSQAFELPTIGDFDVNPYTTIGTELVPLNSKPAVIDGIVQTGN